MSPTDLATLSLLEPEQGVCPDGHRCRLEDHAGRRRCANGEFTGLALICWDLTSAHLEAAAGSGADPTIVEWARMTLADRA